VAEDDTGTYERGPAPLGPYPVVRIMPEPSGQVVWVALNRPDGLNLRVGDAVKIEGTGVSDINGVNIQIENLHIGPEEVKFRHDGTHEVHDKIIYGKGRVTVTQKAPLVV
jgi:hypothetical protein